MRSVRRIILQLSGVGDPEHLARVGIPVHHELRGVGRNLQDHYLARVSCEVQGAPSLNQQSRGLGLAGQVLRYLATGNGILTYAASLVAASVKVLPESATPDVQALFAHGSYAAGVSRQLDTIPGMTCGMWQMRPLSRGYVEARSPRPQEQPNINPRYFSDETDAPRGCRRDAMDPRSCSPRRRWRNTSWPRRCLARTCRATMSCCTT